MVASCRGEGGDILDTLEMGSKMWRGFDERARVHWEHEVDQASIRTVTGANTTWGRDAFGDEHRMYCGFGVNTHRQNGLE